LSYVGKKRESGTIEGSFFVTAKRRGKEMTSFTIDEGKKKKGGEDFDVRKRREEGRELIFSFLKKRGEGRGGAVLTKKIC